MAYRYYMAIDALASAIDSPETNFPVALVLTSANLATVANGGHVYNTDASGGASGSLTVPADFVVSPNSDGSSPYDFEIVDYNPVDGYIELWVEINSLSDSSDTTIYLVYSDSAVITSQENVGGTWGNNYEQVFHFGRTSSDDYFDDHGMSQPFYPLQNPVAVYHSNKTFVTWQGANLDPFVREYDHTAERWSHAYKVGDNPMDPGDSDDHGAPSILRDSSGNLHIFYGCHGGTSSYIQHAKSSSTDDASAWVDKGNIGSQYATYPQPVLASNGDIYVLFGDRDAGSNYFISYIKSTDDGENWGSVTEIIEDSESRYFRCWMEQGSPDKIHIAWARGDAGTNRYDVYYCYFNCSDSKLYAADGTDMGSSVTNTERDNNCVVHDSGTDKTSVPALHVYNGTPYVIWVEEDGSDWDYEWSYWGGSSWTAPSTITTTDHQLDPADLRVTGSSAAEAYLVVGSGGNRGGDIERWTWNGSSWSKQATVRSPGGSDPNYYNPWYVFNYDNDLKVVFCEVDEADYSNSDLKVLAYDSADSAVQAWNTTSTVYDSTSNNRDSVAIVSSPYLAEGVVGGCWRFDGTDDYVEISSVGIYDGSGDYSIQCWVRFDVIDGGNYTVWHPRAEYDVLLGYDDDVGDDFMRFGTYDGGGNYSTHGPLSTDTWYHVAGTYDGDGNQILYVDVTNTDTIASANPASKSDKNTLGTQDLVPPARYLEGWIDELHISSVIRDSDWIKTSEANQSDPAPGSTFWGALGAEQTLLSMSAIAAYYYRMMRAGGC